MQHTHTHTHGTHCTLTLVPSSHVNKVLIQNESQYEGGAITDKVEELIKGTQSVTVMASMLCPLDLLAVSIWLVISHCI